MGWFATPDTSKGAAALQKLIKQISCEVLSSNMPMGFFYLAEMNVPGAAIEKTKVICDVLRRKITIGVSVEDGNDGRPAEKWTVASVGIGQGRSASARGVAVGW